MRVQLSFIKSNEKLVTQQEQYNSKLAEFERVAQLKFGNIFTRQIIGFGFGISDGLGHDNCSVIRAVNFAILILVQIINVQSILEPEFKEIRIAGFQNFLNFQDSLRL